MNRLFWGIALLVLTASGGWAQSTWRGQAEVWATADAPADGYVAASNEFPRNSLLSVENYKTRKTVQVRVVAGLPAGASALVLLNPRAAQALEIKAGEVPLVGVRMDPTGVDRPDNPDPDVNPLAARPDTSVPTTSVAAGTPAIVTPSTPVATAGTAPAPTLAPEPKDTTARTPAAAAVDGTKSSTALDPDLLPLPALAEPTAVPEPTRTPLAVSDDPEPATPVTPGRHVFVTSRDPGPVASETETVTEPTNAPEAPAPEAPPAESPADDASAPVSTAEVPAVEPATEPVPAPAPAVEPAPTPVEPAAVVPPTVPEPAAVASAPATVAPVVPVPAVPSNTWVPVPGKLEGPVLGNVSLLASLEKGKSYVQVGAWATEADVLRVLGSVTSYVPLALYKAEGEKNPWRLVVASAPKGQLGLLLMHYRSQGYRTASVVKG